MIARALDPTAPNNACWCSGRTSALLCQFLNHFWLPRNFEILPQNDREIFKILPRISCIPGNKCKQPIEALLDTDFSHIKYSANDMWLISQLFTGHSALHYFENIIGREPSSCCPSCNSSEQKIPLEHFFGHCPHFRIMQQMFGSSCVCLGDILYSCYMWPR